MGYSGIVECCCKPMNYSLLKINTNINLKEVQIMSKNQMKDRIGEDLNKAKEAGKDAAKATAEAADKAARIMADEARELGKRSVAVAREGLSGMLKGRKDASKKREEED